MAKTLQECLEEAAWHRAIGEMLAYKAMLSYEESEKFVKKLNAFTYAVTDGWNLATDEDVPLLVMSGGTSLNTLKPGMVRLSDGNLYIKTIDGKVVDMDGTVYSHDDLINKLGGLSMCDYLRIMGDSNA